MGKILAIKGHLTRGNEIIGLLEKMGGYADDLIDNGTDEKYAYFIDKDENNAIDGFPIDKKDEFDAQIFTLEEFLEKYPYKVGDEVTIWVENFENRRGSYATVKIECVKWDDHRCEIIYMTKVGGMYIFFEAKDVKNDIKATFSNNHSITPRYIIQLYSPSFETDEPMYLSKCGQNVWNISWDKEIWKAKTYKYERLAKREANKCKNLIIEAAEKGWTSLGYIITEDGKYVPKFTDIDVKILKIEINIV